MSHMTEAHFAADKGIMRRVLDAVSDGPQTITSLAGGAMAYRVRKPIRQAVDALIATGAVKEISLGRTHGALVAADWTPSDAFLRAYFASLCVREGSHLLWEGAFDGRLRRCVVHINGQRYDMRRTLYEIRYGVKLNPTQTLRPRCQHETCMSPGCQDLLERKGQPGSKHHVATKLKLAEAKRSRSKYSRDLIECVKASDKSYKKIALETGMPVSTVGAIRSGRLWKDYSNPFAALMQGTREAAHAGRA